MESEEGSELGERRNREQGSWEEQVEAIADSFNGKMMVSLEEEDWRKMSADNKWAIVFRLANGMAVNINGLSKALCKIWNVEDRVCFKELANDMFLAIFKFKSDMVRIKEGRPWHCLDTVVLMHDWCPDLAPDEFIMNKLGVWAQLHNLPEGAALNDREIGEKLARYIGKFVRVSQNETEETKRKYIRVRVELDIDKPVVEGFYLRRQRREPLWISVKYERLPSLCNRCGRMFHEVGECNNSVREDQLGEKEEWDSMEISKEGLPERSCSDAVALPKSNPSSKGPQAMKRSENIVGGGEGRRSPTDVRRMSIGNEGARLEATDNGRGKDSLSGTFGNLLDVTIAEEPSTLMRREAVSWREAGKYNVTLGPREGMEQKPMLWGPKTLMEDEDGLKEGIDIRWDGSWSPLDIHLRQVRNKFRKGRGETKKKVVTGRFHPYQGTASHISTQTDPSGTTSKISTTDEYVFPAAEVEPSGGGRSSTPPTAMSLVSWNCRGVGGLG